MTARKATDSRKTWTSDQDRLLSEGWQAGLDVGVIASRLAKTETSVRGRAQTLGLKRSAEHLHALRSRQSSGQSNPNCSWTPEEEQELSRLWVVNGLSLSEIAPLMPQKTANAIKAKAKRLGLRHSKDQTAALLSRLNAGERNGMFGRPGPNLGKPMPETTKARLRQAAVEGFKKGTRKRLVGESNPMFGKPSYNRGIRQTLQAKEIASHKASERWGRRSKEFQRSHLLKMRQGWVRWSSAGHRTWIEREVEGWLIAQGVAFTCQAIVDFYVVDFLLADGRVIETHGDYWHANPATYDPNVLDRTQRSNLRRDRAKAALFERRGRKMLVLWERDIRMSPLGARRALQEFLDV